MEEAADPPGDHHLPPPPLPQVRAPEDDLLTCGQCSQAFPLAHILAFIQHKQGGCVSRSPGSGATPPSPAGQAGRQQVAGVEPQPGFIELRRGASRGRSWGYESGLSVKADLSKLGETPQQGGGLLTTESVFLCFFFQSFFYSVNNRSSSRSSPAH